MPYGFVVFILITQLRFTLMFVLEMKVMGTSYLIYNSIHSGLTLSHRCTKEALPFVWTSFP